MRTVAPDSVGFSASRLARIGPAMQGFVDRGEIAGIVSLVARHGQIVHFECTGYQDLESRKPMAEDSLFRVYSMSKPITTVAALMLYEEGYFLLDDPISRFIPELGRVKVFAGKTADGFTLVDAERPITIRHLLTHTSGLGYGLNASTPVERAYIDAGMLRPDETLAEKMPRLAELPLAFQPGTAWNYSMAIDVLGRLVEVVSRQPFDQFLQERLFGPLGMTDAGFFVPPSERGRLVPVYVPTSDGSIARSNNPMFEYAEKPRFLSGGGGLVMTAGDYGRFAQMLLYGGELDGVRILGRKTVELMATSQTPREKLPVVPPDWAFREGYGMALGVRTLVDLGASGALGSVGTYTWQGMAATDFWVDPAEDLFGLAMLQRVPGYYRPAETLRVLSYQALVD